MRLRQQLLSGYLVMRLLGRSHNLCAPLCLRASVVSQDWFVTMEAAVPFQQVSKKAERETNQSSDSYISRHLSKAVSIFF